MDDPGWSWPAWKFGMKRDDLFTSLHDQYNTFTFSLQDPEAFHADVYEISRDADSTEEFHRLLADRRKQRLRELHESLESLAYEIIANPQLMDSQHWNDALHLFRTRSFDSLVRYFAAYLPDGSMTRDERSAPSAGSSFSDATSVHTASTKASSVDGAPAQYTTVLDGSAITEEPCPLDTEGYHHHHHHHHHQTVDTPLSPSGSMSTVSECSETSSTDDVESHRHSTNPPSRSMSFSGSESEAFRPDFCRHPMMRDDDETTSESDSVDTGASSFSDCAESHSSLDSVDDKPQGLPSNLEEEEDDDPDTAQFPEDAFDTLDMMTADNNTGVEADAETFETIESDTPTPRQEGVSSGSSYIDYKSILCRRLPSPTRRSPSPRAHRAIGSPPLEVRRSPDEAHSKIQKASPDSIRKRPKGRI